MILMLVMLKKGVNSMRIWHCELLPYLPDLQFRGQLRELVLIMHDWRDREKTNHLLVNKVMDYPKSELSRYFAEYVIEYRARYNKEIKQKYIDEFAEFAEGTKLGCDLFIGWHNKEYLRICVANLYEKYSYAVGKSKITDDEWDKLLKGYKNITGEDWVL